MNRSLLLLLLLIFIGNSTKIKAQETRDINDIIHIIKNRAQYPNYVLVAAHRGYWMDYPENSIPAYNAAIRLGADIVEMDVRITFDEEMVIFHDACLERVTTGYGTLRTATFNEVRNLKLKNLDGTLTGENLLTLNDALDALKGKAVASIDIKETGEYFNKTLIKVIKLAQQKEMLNQLLIKGKLRLADLNNVLQQAGVTLDDIIYTPIAFDNTANLDAYINEYINSGKIYAFELVYKRSASPILSYVPKLQQKNIWVGQYTFWPEHAEGVVAERAPLVDCEPVLRNYYFKDQPVTVNDPLDDGRGDWDWLIEKGADYLITDRSELMIDYLKIISKRTK